MKQASKNKKRLAARRKAWEAMPSEGVVGNTKKVRRHDGKSGPVFHKPGSQNGRK